jgi:hypothetical protein
MNRFARALAIAVFPLLALPACSKANNVDQSKKTTNNITSGKVDEEGGLIGDRNGLGVFIPKYALEDQVDISLRTLSPGDFSGLPSGAVGDVYSFEPHGPLFFTDVDIYLPRPTSSPSFQAYYSDDGSAWSLVGGAIDVKTSSIHFTTASFALFVAVDATQGGPNVPDGGVGGQYGSGGAGTAMPPGGSSGVGETCMPDASAKPGGTDASGTLASQTNTDIQFRPVDGFVSTFDMGGPTQVSLLLSDMPEACGTSIASGDHPGKVGLDPAGRAGSSTLAVVFETPVAFATGTYDIVQASHSLFDSQCGPERVSQAVTGTVEVTQLDPDRVIGTVNLTDSATARSFSGSFDVPLCALSEQPAGRCCVQ